MRASDKLASFLVTLPRTAKSQELFRLTSLCHIAIRVEAYKALNGLTQCYNCQQFGHVWANHSLWCGGGHLHKECPERGHASSTPACCNCRLAEREKPHTSNYRGCRHAKRKCSEGSLRKRPRQPRKGCCLQNSPLPVYPSRRHWKATQRISGSLQHARCQSQLLP
jgi:hypothetical protein